MAVRPPQLIGESPLFHALLDRVSDLASLDCPILITGEAGTGKELMGSRLHFLSPRWEQSYQSVDCTAYDDEDLHGLVFGQADYAGRNSSDGRLVDADSGTCLLHNIDQTSAAFQARLARTILHGEFMTPDGAQIQRLDVRIICTSREDLPLAVSEGRFSAALLDAMSFEVLRLPPLRGRFEDITALAEHFGRKVAASLGAERFPGFTPEALAVLAEQPWPTNVRGLKVAAERSVANAYLIDETLAQPINKLRLNPFGAPVKPLQMKPSEVTDVPETTPLETTDFTERVMTFERGLIDQALTQHDHHQGKAAEYLGLTYHQFRGLLRKHGMKK